MSRFSWLFRRRHADRELAREVEAHMAERVDDLLEDGVAPEDARAQARREFGNVVLNSERSREVWLPFWLTTLAQDLRYAARSLVHQPGFSLSAVGILAIGIGLVSAMFTVGNAQLLRPWAVPDPSSLAIVTPLPAPGQPYGSLSNPEYRFLREHNRSFIHLATWLRGGGPISYNGSTRNVQSNFVSANYFDTLRIGMLMGRGFFPEEENYQSPVAVAVVSERLWRTTLGSSASIVGSTILVYDQPFLVVGVAEKGFVGGDSISVDLWMPVPSISLTFPGAAEEWRANLNDPKHGGLGVVGRLRQDVGGEAAKAELDGLGRQFRASLSMDSHGFELRSTRPISMSPDRLGQLPVLAVMFGALLLVMLLACANVGNLILARGLMRQREVAIRLALGAGRARVIRQLLTEALLLSLAAGAAGLALSNAVPRLFLYAVGNVHTNTARLSPDMPVFAFTLAMALLACLIAGLAPALRTTRTDIAGRANERHAGSRRAGRLRTALLAAQIALSMVLLVGAGLLTRAVDQAMTLDPGFPIHEVQAIDVQLPESIPRENRAVFFSAIADTLERNDFPVAFSDFTLITGAAMNSHFRRQDADPDAARLLLVRPVSPAYFDVTGIPMVAGRSLLGGDAREVVLNESAASLFWPDDSPLGKQLVTSNRQKGTTSYEVVGLVRDVAVASLSATQPVVYWPSSMAGPIILLRDLSPITVERIEAVVRGLEPSAAVSVRPATDDVREALREVTFGSRFAWSLGLLALILATAGAFGVFAYMVEERRREIGVRMALGARAPQVLRTIIVGARAPLIFGLAGGVVLSMLGAQLLRGTLYGLSPFDPLTYLGVSGILIIAALIATWIPARRATCVDPVIALRAD